MAVTQAQLREIFYDILREEESDTSAYNTTLANLMLDSWHQRINNWYVSNPLTKDTAIKWKLAYLNKTAFYSNVPPTTLSKVTTIWAATLTVASTTNFASSGNLYIWWNIITYTWKTDTTFTWCDWVLFAFKAGVEISQAFDVPSDYWNVINVTYNNKFKLPAKLYDDIFEDLNKYKDNNYWTDYISTQWDPYQVDPFYSIIDNKYLLIYNLTDLAGSILFRYERSTPAMSDSQDTLIDNDIYAKTTIPYLAVAEMLYNRWEEQRAAELFNFVIWQIKEMYNYYNKKSFENISGVQYTMWKSTLNI